MKKALFHDTLVDVLEKSDKGYRINTAYCEILTQPDKITELPDELVKPYESELIKIDEFITRVRNKADEIDQRYYIKKQELDDAITKAKARKNEIIRTIKAKSMNLTERSG
jgi:hypothetical protein